MRTIISTIFAIIFTWAAYADPLGTNVLFPPETYGRIGYQTEKGNREQNEQIIKNAVNAGECRSAELDPDGHWGEVADGFQMSIRSNTNVFAVGKPMPVGVILRNTTTNTLLRLSVSDGNSNGSPLGDGGEVLLSVEDESGHIRDNEGPGNAFADLENLSAKHQDKHIYDLNSSFHLGIGIYKIHASQMVRGQSPQNGKPVFSNISSGILTIKVISP